MAAGREAHQEKEEVDVEDDDYSYGDDDDEEDDYSYGGDDDGEVVGDEGGGDSDDLSSSSGDEKVSKPFPANLKPLKHMAKREGSSAWPPAAPTPGFTLPPRLPAPRASPRFISASVPGSRSSSPRSPSGTDLAAALQKWGRPSRSSRSNPNPQSRRRSPAPSHLSGRRKRDTGLRRSKSCGEGRASQPPDELDIWPNLTPPDQREPEGDVVDLDGEGGSNEKDPKKTHAQGEEGFKCGAFCMFLPGFSKGKQVQPAHKEAADGQDPGPAARVSVASRAVSLEKFECGSWSSSVILNGAGEEEGIPQSYFDLPLELMRGSGNDSESPVKAAFVFDRDRRGVLKRSGSRGAAVAATTRGSHESPARHVTFSAGAGAHGSVPSSPTAFCISPRLRRARAEFNALLEAQNV